MLIPIGLQAQSSSDESDFSPSVYYRIFTKNGGTRCVDIVGEKSYEGEKLCIWSNIANRTTEDWVIKKVGNYYQFLSRNGGWAINDPTTGDVTATTNTGTQLNLAAVDPNSKSQLWEIVPQDGGYYNIINVHTQHTMNLSGGNNADGTALISYKSDGLNATSQNRQWKFVAGDPVNGINNEPEPYAVLSNYNTVLTFYYDDQKEARGGMDVGGFVSSAQRGWDGASESITSVIFDASFANCTTLTSTRYWFAFCRNLTSVTGISNLNTENVTDMGCMFEGCTGLKALDLSGFKTDNARYLDMMFYNCSSLTSLDVSGFNTNNVTDMGLMFYSCPGLTSLDLSSFNTNNVTRMDHMFEKCSGLTTIVVSNSWSTAKVIESNDMFSGCTKLVGGRGTTYNANHTDATYAHIDGGTSNPGYFTDINAIVDSEPYAVLSNDNTVLTFYYDNQKAARGGMSVGPFESNASRGWDGAAKTVKSIVFDESFAECNSLTSTAFWFYNCKNLTSITGISNLKTDNVTNMSYMFSGCSGLTSLDLSGFNTEKVTDISSMFSGCSGLTSLDVSGFNTDNVTDMSSMFYGCSGLASLDVSVFNTEKVTDMSSMFYGCSGLTSLDLNNFYTNNVTNMYRMFSGCTCLTSLDLSGFKTDNVTYMDYIFDGCTGLTSLDVSGFKTDNVTYMDYMFYCCSGLTSLDLSGFKTDNVTYMRNMFNGCSGLTTIYVGDGWSTTKVTLSYSMFIGCTNLVGGQGTTYNANHIDATYAHIDGGTANPGYFTDKNATAFCETPTVSRDGTSNQIIISCATAGASIYYTTNGTTPTENNTQYTGPITVSKNCTIKAIAVKDGYESSSVASYSIDWFKVATPTFGYSNLQLTISTATSDATIYYTTNGTTPTTSSTRYTGAISLTSDCTVKAIAVKDDYTNSDVASFSFVKSNYTCQAPQISRNGTGNQVVMTCATSGASIYYTTDGTTPTQASVRYTGAITFDHNQTIRAVAIKDGMFNSSQTQFSVDWFKVATPTFSYSNLKLTISTATSGATIYYTIDGSNPLADLSKAIRYTVPVRLEADAQVKSVAVKTDFNNSDVASYTFVKSDYTCKAPQIQRDGSSDRVTMSSATENAVIYYTTDGSEPSTTSTRYTGPVTMTYNCTVRAIAARSDMFSSGVSEFAVDWLTISGVTVAYNNGVLTLTCASSGAEIHYEIGGKDATKSSPLYTGSITLTDNREVRYVIYVTGMEPVSGSYTPTDFTCAPVTLSYDGLNIILSTAEEGATIYYTTDGSIPTTSSEIYRGKTPLSGLCTVNAFAEKTFKNNSEMMQIPITYFFDGRTVFLSEPGHVGDAVQWRGTEGMQELRIQCEGQGVVNDKDLSALRAIKSLKHLDLVDARFENNSVPNGAFAGMNIVSVEFPGKNITTLGNVFSGCEHLAAIIWNARTPVVRTTAAAAGITNPNLLLYVDNEAYAPNDVRNVIANGSASSIVLTDSGSYYCPQEFLAQVISYSHTYTQVTGINKRSGWETIALPFDVQSITHELQGRIAPFAADDAMARPFWLGELSSSGFKRAAEIKANTPYIISMPNNEVYGSAYILAGKVTFEASNMTVPATNIITTSKGDHVFTPCFDAVEASPSVYAINKNDRNSNHVEGSVFLPDTRDVKPFEAYIAVPTNGVAPRYIPIRDDSDTGIENLTPTLSQGEGAVYDLTGRKVQGELKRGVYIINGNKVMVK